MSVLTRVSPNELDGTVGASASVVLKMDNTRQLLVVQNSAATGGNNLAFTLDGITTPVINSKGVQLVPGQAAFFDVCVPCGPINIIASGSNTPFVILYG